ncbi:hypothetical protein SAMN06265222_11592 [Neorhodopirellula lusitana]|uniref:Uncharacterized protein n=1 Tax=Neorhodopirellula lusitana TaxID=445327 RepID=A0ABY1QIT9_9BACT|nr:hypothetical protein SAMN06265222_11592 [Neorhodopirellula lusitana]
MIARTAVASASTSVFCAPKRWLVTVASQRRSANCVRRLVSGAPSNVVRTTMIIAKLAPKRVANAWTLAEQWQHRAELFFDDSASQEFEQVF